MRPLDYMIILIRLVDRSFEVFIKWNAAPTFEKMVPVKHGLKGSVERYSGCPI